MCAQIWAHTLVKETKWVTTCKTNDYGCAYACTLHKVQLKHTHCHTIAWINNVRFRDYHQMHVLWLRSL
jgi:hypothetical protein